jgi:pimeloyl-ACP methyl ester carboxylesterase
MKRSINNLVSKQFLHFYFLKLIISFLAIFLLAISCNKQKTTKANFEKILFDKTDSTRNCYTILYPLNHPYKGYVFLLPGFGESAEDVMEQTNLPNLLAANGLLTIIPTVQDGVLSFGVDSISQKTLHKIMADIVKKHNLSKEKFYIGGFSIGGSAAIKYAENALNKPSAVFAIDPPLDFERFYNGAKRDVRLSKNEANEENIYMIERLEKEAGGSPSTNLNDYYDMSPYSFSDTTQAALKNILNVPLRIYTEPDITWWLKEHGADMTSMNATECSAMINELNKLGNEDASLIITHHKGYRKPNNSRHPHSWSIVDNEELITWLMK